MKSIAVVIASAVVLAAALPTWATVSASVETIGADKIYSYIYTNTEEPFDKITGFHVYAPVDVSLVSAWTADAGWDFHTAPDISGALDIYWDTQDPAAHGLASGAQVFLSFRTPVTIETDYAYVLPDFQIGNWGYDTEMTGGAWTMFGSVPVPYGTPEPTTCAALALGCSWLIVRRKRR